MVFGLAQAVAHESHPYDGSVRRVIAPHGVIVAPENPIRLTEQSLNLRRFQEQVQQLGLCQFERAMMPEFHHTGVGIDFPEQASLTWGINFAIVLSPPAPVDLAKNLALAAAGANPLSSSNRLPAAHRREYQQTQKSHGLVPVKNLLDQRGGRLGLPVDRVAQLRHPHRDRQ